MAEEHAQAMKEVLDQYRTKVKDLKAATPPYAFLSSRPHPTS